MSIELPYDQNWTTDKGFHDGGVSTGVGYTISWQRGPVVGNGRNGAFLLEVLTSCYTQLLYCEEGSGSNKSPFSCSENRQALDALEQAISALRSRRDRRASEGTLGTHELSPLVAVDCDSAAAVRDRDS